MPELPEVQTTVNYLKKALPGRKIVRLWTDWPKAVKRPASFKEFEKALLGSKILDIRRRGKNILIALSGGKTLLIHQKMTGHLLVGRWKQQKGKWISLISGPLKDDPLNGYLHLIFWLDNGRQMALSDLRKFAKVELYFHSVIERKKDNLGIKELDELGPEPLAKNFSFGNFKARLRGRKAAIKKILMDQKIIAGIGNIYADEILWAAKVHPKTEANKLTSYQLKAIYDSIGPILREALKKQGTSFGDYRKPDGTQGAYQKARRVYGRENQACPRCGAKIKRLKLGQRSAHYCPTCQAEPDR
jgi:formamidopyrimidine-DNA glycosylase